MRTDWEVPRVDLLDIERTAHVDAIEAADGLEEFVAATADHLEDMARLGDAPPRDPIEWARQLRAVAGIYRVARGLDKATDCP